MAVPGLYTSPAVLVLIKYTDKNNCKNNNDDEEDKDDDDKGNENDDNAVVIDGRKVWNKLEHNIDTGLT